MNGWNSRPGDSWDDEPAWVYEITWEWEPVPGQRYPGDPGRRKAVHTPVYEASRGGSAPASSVPVSPAGRASVPGSSWNGDQNQSWYEDSRGPSVAPQPGRQQPGQAQRPPQPPREEPAWNRSIHMHNPMPGGSPAPASASPPDQRRGSAPVYGRAAGDQQPSGRPFPDQPGQPSSGRPFPEQPGQFGQFGAGGGPGRPSHPPVPVNPGPALPSAPISPGRTGRPPAGRVPQQPRPSDTPGGTGWSRGPGQPAPPAGGPYGGDQHAGSRGAAVPPAPFGGQGPGAPARHEGQPGRHEQGARFGGPVAPAAPAGYVPGQADQDPAYQGRRQAADQYLPHQGEETHPNPGAPAPAGHSYGAARPAPADAFPAYPDDRRTPHAGRTPDAPFDLRPAPQDRNSPAPSRPAPQPTRVTPQQPVVSPAAVRPGQSPGMSVPIVPGGVAPISGPATPYLPAGRPAHAAAPVSGPAAPGGWQPRGDQDRWESGRVANSPAATDAAPVSGAGVSFPRGPQEAVGVSAGLGYDEQDPTRPLDPRRVAHAAPEHARNDNAPEPEDPTRPFGLRRSGGMSPDHTEDRTQAIDTRLVEAYAAEAGERSATAERRHSGTGEHIGTGGPHGFGTTAPGRETGSPGPVDQPYAGVGPAAAQGQPFTAEQAAAPVTVQSIPAEPVTPVAEEPETHGLGWLLSMSGLGATNPAPEAEAAPPAETVAVVAEPRPQGWFAPADPDSDDQEITDFAAPEPATTGPDATPTETISVEDIRVEDVSVEDVSVEDADQATVRAEPAEPENARAENIEAESARSDETGTDGTRSEDTWYEDTSTEPVAVLTDGTTPDHARTETGEADGGQVDLMEDPAEPEYDPIDVPETDLGASGAEQVTPDTHQTEPVAPQVERIDFGAAYASAEVAGDFAGAGDSPSEQKFEDARVDDAAPEASGVMEADIPDSEADLPRDRGTGTDSVQGSDSPTADSQVVGSAAGEPPAVESARDDAENRQDTVIDAEGRSADVSQHEQAEQAESDEQAEQSAQAEHDKQDEHDAQSAQAEHDKQDEHDAQSAQAEHDKQDEHDPQSAQAEHDEQAALDGRTPAAEFVAPDADGGDPDEAETARVPQPAIVESAATPEFLENTGAADSADPADVPETEPAETELPETVARVADTADDTAVTAGAATAQSGDPAAGEDRAGAPAVPPKGSGEDPPGGAAETVSAGSSRKARPEAPAALVRQRRDQRTPADRRRADPEQLLASYAWTFDPRTLREHVGEPDRLWDLVDRLSDRLEFAERDTVRAGLLSLRAVVSRTLGELDDALTDGRDGLRHAEASGDLRAVSIAQARLAHILQWRGEFDEADRLFAKADSVELPSRTRAEIAELAGRSAFDQGRLMEAVNHFERALDVRAGDDPELVERIELALDEITRRSADGWGPYPRTRSELLGLPETPVPLLDDGTGLWGFAAAVEPRYAEVLPFTEGVAWVRRPESQLWELIDQAGEVVIPAVRGYLAVGPFAEGLAWVQRDANGWFAIDRSNRPAVPPAAFEQVRPFRNGMALVRQAGLWGAVDRHGRIVVRPRFRQFTTSLHVGGAVDGFTGEGLAVVDAGDRFGVLHRSGELLVQAVHAAVVIHPSAYLVRNAAGLWGALDRQGAPLVDMSHRDPSSVVDQLPEQTRPVL